MTMIELRWDDADLYAYLDGQLAPQQVEALETELKDNAELRARLETLRLTLTFIQDVPLREAPRNYLLTPSMVKPPESEPTRPRRPLLFAMRLATTLSALVFVVMAGLLVDVNMTSQPAALPQEKALSVEAPEPSRAQGTREVEKAVEVEALSAPEEHLETEALAPSARVTVTEKGADEAGETETEARGGGTAPVWDDGENGAPQGLGIGGAPPEETPGICMPDKTSGACVEEEAEVTPPAGEETVGSEIELTPTATSEAREEPLSAAQPPPSQPPSWQIWLTLVFGLSTIGLGMATWWLTRRR
ncbi:MAG: anti-sigma factor family protein [Anaerolineae bacterium]